MTATKPRIDRSGIEPVAYLADGTVAVGEAAVSRVERGMSDGPSEADKAEARIAAEQAKRQAVRDDAAAALPDLEASEAKAREAEAAAHEAFLAAVAADPVLTAFRDYRDAVRRHDRARYHAGAARARSRGAAEGSGSFRTLRLVDALAAALDEPRPGDTDLHGGLG